ncbi:MAG TPA: hypothetical protein VLU96_12540 [Gaiellaceae bacterium]|nr:hypothetical protein [Gaiellaceae bacterium]
MNREPDFRELVGEDVEPEERERLEHVHDLLVAAGPPAELPPGLVDPDAEYAEAQTYDFLPRRRTGAVLALAAAIALIAFLGGYLTGQHKGGQFPAIRTVAMRGTALEPAASGTVAIGELTGGGNWPLEVIVNNLPRLPHDGYYEMLLTKNGKPTASCGTFVASGPSVTVRLNAPYNLRSFNGWVVTRHVPGTRGHPAVLTTSIA